VHQEEDWYVSRCLELEVASQGRSVDEALANLREAVEAYLDEVSQPTQ
jgi:predicted RNase H-like HicB family nuclease